MFITIAGEDAKFTRQLEQLLLPQNHRLAIVASLTSLIKSLRASPPDLLVVAHPASAAQAAGVLRAVREDESLRRMPILCVDPKSEVSAGVAFLDAGADDFLNRPFNPAIFLARVRTLLRRRIWSGEAEEEAVTILESGPLVVRLVSRLATLKALPISLTRLQFELLAHLMKNVDRVFKREELLQEVWNYPGNVETRTLDKHVEALRKKLGDHAACLQTVHGVGYRFVSLAPSRSRAR
jgi:two-component system alkaline phosphatase synthesis response regulator PhoP